MDNANMEQITMLQIRLDTKSHLDDIKGFLMGKILSQKTTHEDGRVLIEDVWEKAGEPMMNEQGIQSIMARLSSLIDPSVVQGNLEKWDDLREIIGWFRQDMNDVMMNNLYNWGIDLSNYDYVLDFLTDKTKLFLSRLVGDKERQSYSQTMRTHEVNKIQTQEQQSKWKMPLFGNTN